MRRLLPLLLLAAGCARPLPRIHYAPQVSEPPQEQIPEGEAFEPLLEEKGRFIDALFAIDKMVEGDKGQDAARDAYGKLLAKARPLAEAAANQSGAYGAALEILGVLRKEGFVFDDSLWGTSPKFGSITNSLTARKGICLSFTMLTLALLDSCGLEGCSATYPRHILVRVLNAGKEVELESTVFGDPVAMHYPEDFASKSAREGYSFCRSFDRQESGWVYLSERLWRWAPRRARDGRSFRLLERTELKLNGSNTSISMQWALRQQWRSNSPTLNAKDKAEARRLAVEEYERLIRWDPDDPRAYLLLSLVHQSSGDLRSELLVLRRFMETGPGDDSPWSRITQARWWIRRRGAEDEFRLKPDERQRGDEYLKKHFPDTDPVARVEVEMWKLLEVSDP